MSHLDEGTLHALLDGELDLAEVSEIQKHLGSCVACGSRLQEVKQVLAEADRLVGAMEVPASAPRPRSEAPRSEAPRPGPEPQPSLSRPAHEPLAWDEPPVLLVPDPIDAHAKRRRIIRWLAVAATLAGIVTGGKLIGRAFQPSHPMLSDRDLTSVSQPTAQPTVSPEESRKPESTLATRENKLSRIQPQRAPAAAPTPSPARAKVSVDTSSLPADGDSAVSDSAADSLALAEAAADSANELEAAAGVAATAAGGAQETGPETEPSSSNADDLATRRAAAAALAELDRERRRERANAATAALPPARAEAGPEPAAPRPPTLEQRSQVYLRIGLDEAVKQLGGPVHVIEGMTPQLIGLTRTQLIPGTTSTRPVVRVVYTDNRGRLILLDQQRMASGQALTTPAGSLRWTIGDVMLYLRGEPSPDVLKSLQARVR